MKPWTQWTIAAPLALVAWSASAQAQEAQTRVAAAACAACHGTAGVNQGGIPGLAGASKTQLWEKLQAYKQGELPATVMHQHAKGYSDAELERLADFFSRQKS